MTRLQPPGRRPRWRRSALLFSAGSLATFVANLSFTIWAVTWARQQDLSNNSNINTTITNHNSGTWQVSTGRGSSDGVGVLLSDSSCAAAKGVNTGVHVLINVLSTVLLAGSNYCMQALSAPTRGQIDEAHRRSRWVDVGVPSVRNLAVAVPWGNVLLWALLSLSSLPLHLFYNSAIFTSISTNEYNITIVNEGFMALQNRSALPAYLKTPASEAMRDAALDGRLERLDTAACLDAYASNFQSTRGDLLLVTPGLELPQARPSGFQLRREAVYATANYACGIRQAFQWMCSQYNMTDVLCPTPCEDLIPDLRADPTSWRPFGAQVSECYSQRTEERCKLLFSPTLCWVVTGLNLFKGLLMLAVALRRDWKPVLTVGDAVASFLEEPDDATVDMCLVSKQDIEQSGALWPREPRAVEYRRRAKFAAASGRRWTLCLMIYIVAIALCAVLYSVGLNSISGAKDFQSLMDLGLGTLSSKTLIQSDLFGRGWGSLLGNVVMANSPQAIMSMLYFTYNGLFTSISVASEWDRFAKQRKGLRVSSAPSGAQRTTYFLQLPYRYSIPLLGISGLLHWLISQSIFLVFIEVYRGSVEEGRAEAPALDYTTCGWSPAGVVSVMAVGGFMVVFLLASGSRKLGSGFMPVAGSCSAAISAACHPVPRECLASIEPLQWGAMGPDEDKKGHCAFSSGEVRFPSEGIMYS